MASSATDVFVSYKAEDRARLKTLVAALEAEGFDVWWDARIGTGANWREEIQQHLDAARCVIVAWSKQSVGPEGHFVRDEATRAKRRGSYVPIRLDDVEPPLGFGEVQAPLFSGWKGKRTDPRFVALVDAVKIHLTGEAPVVRRSVVSEPKVLRRTMIAGGVGALLIALLAISFVIWRTWGSARPVVVAVRAADQSTASHALARDLIIQLGELRPVLSGSMRLVNSPLASSAKPDLVFQTGEHSNGSSAGASLVLANADDDVLWSKTFEDPKAQVADVRQQIAFTAARVLRCALQEHSGKYGRLQTDLRQVYLNACAASAELGWDTRSLVAPLRQVTEAAPNFRPGWAQLLIAEQSALTFTEATKASSDDLRKALLQDIQRTRERFPDMAEATVAEYAANPDIALEKSVALLDKAKSQDPDNPLVLLEHAIALSIVGRNADSIDDMQRAADLDPLSPSIRSNLIRALAYTGQIDAARAELERAKRIWPGTKTVKEAEFTIEFRYGDFEKAIRASGEMRGSEVDLYIAARRDPSDANVQRFVDIVRYVRNEPSRLIFGLQALGEMNRVNEVYKMLAASPIETTLKGDTYVLFRPWLAVVRGDPRFMSIAARMGLVTYWRNSGHWPHFCDSSDLPYDCKAEAAKLL